MKVTFSWRVRAAMAGAAVVAGGCLAGCGASSPTVTVTVAPGGTSAASTAQPGTSAQATTAPPAPAPSNSLAASFRDGTQVLVAGGAQDSGGSTTGWTEDIEVIAGPNGFANVGSLQIQDMSDDPGGTWQSLSTPLYYYGYASPGSSDTSEPVLPDNPTNQDVSPPGELAPGASICIEEDFGNQSASADSEGPAGYTVTATLADGSTGSVTVPTDGSGPGHSCLFDG